MMKASNYRNISLVSLLGAFLLIGMAVFSSAYAQNHSAYNNNEAESSVEIDHSVLDGLGGAPSSQGYRNENGYNQQNNDYYNAPPQPLYRPAQGNSSAAAYQQRQPVYSGYQARQRDPVHQQQKRITLRPPPGVPVLPAPSSRDVSSYKEVKEAKQPYKPTLIAPDKKQLDRYTTNSNNKPVRINQSNNNNGSAIEWNGPRVGSRVVADNNHQPRVPENEAVAYPVNVKSKTNSYDSIDSFEADQEKKRNERKNKGAKNRQVPAVIAKNIPIPPKRPAVKKASLSFVNNARKENDMPAMTKKEVEQADAKSLISDVYEYDDLGKNLKEPDKETMVKHVGKLMPARDKAKSLNDIAPAAAASMRNVRLHDPENGMANNLKRNTKEPAVKEKIALQKEQHTPRAPIEKPDSSDKKQDYEATPAAMERKFISMPFPPETSVLDFKMQNTLDRQIIPVLRTDTGRRLQIQAFAAGDSEDGISAGARRLSLSRALAVREYLMAGGIDSRRIDVRALGAKTKRKPADRVDLVFFNSSEPKEVQ